jgi:hypothetical protein
MEAVAQSLERAVACRGPWLGSVLPVPKRVPPFRLDAHPLSQEAEEAAGFEWASPEVGTRHRIGGEPTSVTESAFPRCRSCGHAMSFYGQLDSIGDDFALADVGVVEVFVCFDCFEADARVVST